MLSTIEIFSDIFVLSLCYYFEHRPWIVWPFFTNLYKLYFFLIILCQVDKFRKSTMAKKTRLHWVSNKELQCSHWNIKPEKQFLHFKEKTVILFGYSFTSHHPVISTIKCQFLRGQLLIISCILRVQYLCRRFMHLYFTP